MGFQTLSYIERGEGRSSLRVIIATWRKAWHEIARFSPPPFVVGNIFLSVIGIEPILLPFYFTNDRNFPRVIVPHRNLHLCVCIQKNPYQILLIKKGLFFVRNL